MSVLLLTTDLNCQQMIVTMYGGQKISGASVLFNWSYLTSGVWSYLTPQLVS